MAAAEDAITPGKGRGVKYCACGCGEEIEDGNSHRIPDGQAALWLRSIRRGISDMEIAAIRGKSGARLTARHWLLDGDPRLSEMQVNGRSNRGRRFEDRKGGGRWSVVGAVPTISKAEWVGSKEAKSPPTADKPKARAAASTADELFEWMDSIDGEVDVMFSRDDSRALKALLKRAGEHILDLLGNEEDLEAELAALRAEVDEKVRSATMATKEEMAELTDQLKRLTGEVEAQNAAEEGAMRGELTEATAMASLTYEALHPKTGNEHMRKRVSNYAFFRSYRTLVAFFEFLEVGGALDAVRLRRGAEDDADDRPDKKTRQGARSLTPRDSIFFVLFVLRTGIDVVDASPLFGLDDSSGSRYFSSYLCFLHEWLSAEFPTPSKEQIIAATPERFKNKIPNWDLQLIFDATEFRTEFPEDLMVYRTLWSAYKHWTTVKMLGAIYPCPGGFCAQTADPTAFGGAAGDVPCTLASPLMGLLEDQMCSLADKGFTLHAEFAAKGHYLAIPMYAYNKQKSFTIEDSAMSHTIGHLRIYIEEAFRRVREFKIFRKQVKMSQLDLIGKIYSVCALLTNFQTLLEKDPSDPHISIAERLWGFYR